MFISLCNATVGLSLPSHDTLAVSEAFPKDVIYWAQEKGWMMEELMLEWLKIV
jgi:hypothetical protein